MRTRTHYPYETDAIENVFIPLADGVRLAARIWMPREAPQRPKPAILEYIPYRKRDLKRPRDELIHPYYAGHGYACVRVDLRGSGDSDGVLVDEYLEQELRDGQEVLSWIAAQPWCNGTVGVIGISWGGFNGLQLAARRPPELGAVVSIASTDDRYADDVHYMGGCLLIDNLSWASVMFALNSLPPDPAVVGESWRTAWFDRLEGSGLWLETWLRHQHRDDYWKHGSISENFSDVQVPVMAVSGWADGYTNAVFRLLRCLESPRQGLVGPWSHKYPHLGVPGPAIGFLQETLRWWDYWLKGIDTGIMDEPMLRAYMQDSVPPHTSYAHRPGRWVGEPSWPSPTVGQRRYLLGGRWRLVDEEQDAEVLETQLTVQSPLTLGLFAGKWCSYAASPDLPHDQREDDGGALVFESSPLEEPIEILGAPYVDLELSASAPVAMVAVRLSDTAPDDNSTRVSYGVLNLTHRESHEHPEPLEVDKPYRVRVKMNDVGQRFPAGNRLRLSISTSYWPLAWAPRQPVRLTIHTGYSSLTIPVRPARDEDATVGFLPAEASPPLVSEVLAAGENNWTVTRDLASDRSTLQVINDEGRRWIEALGLEVEQCTREWYSSYGNDHESVSGEVETTVALRREGFDIRTITRTVLSSTAAEFVLRAELDAYEGGARVHSRNWHTRIPRDLV